LVLLLLAIAQEDVDDRNLRAPPWRCGKDGDERIHATA
jgi:hypothetical protein